MYAVENSDISVGLCYMYHDCVFGYIQGFIISISLILTFSDMALLVR